MKLSSAFLLLATVSWGFAMPLNSASPGLHCQDIMLPIRTSAKNVAFPPFNSTIPGALYTYLGSLANSTLGFRHVSGVYSISATYCEPTVKVAERENTIQLLVHGVAYTKNYWSGINYPSPSFPGQYSWTHHATSQGYATLAIDRLGNGASDHPDPVTIVQGTLHVEIMQAIITQLRTGSLPNITSAYKKVILVTHSYGSILGRSLAAVHPNDGADAYILTAASNSLTGFADALETFQIESALITYPHHANLAPGYASISPVGIRLTTYSQDGDFSPSLLAHDQKQDHIFAIGEIAAQIPNTISNFAGPVMVLTGKQDQIVCGVGNITTEVGDCGIGKESNPYGEKKLFPKAKEFGLYIPDHTGHNANLHFSSGEVFGAAHEWLESIGF